MTYILQYILNSIYISVLATGAVLSEGDIIIYHISFYFLSSTPNRLALTVTYVDSTQKHQLTFTHDRHGNTETQRHEITQKERRNIERQRH